MSVSFLGVGGEDELNISNGAASNVLSAMGYKVTESTDGSMSLTDAKKGIEQARKTLTGQNLEFLEVLSQIVGELEANGDQTLSWT